MGQSVADIKNALLNNGTSQSQRSLVALKPSSVKIDGRTVQDYLLFTTEFAKRIKYFDVTDNEAGDWSAFWNADNSFIIAAIEKTNPIPIKKEFEAILEELPSGLQIRKLIHQTLEILRQIEEWHRHIQSTSPLKSEISRLVKANLNTLLPRLLSYEKGARRIDVINYPEIDLTVYRLKNGSPFSPMWNLADPEVVEADTSFFTPEFELDEETGDFKIPDLDDPKVRIRAAKDRLEELFTETYNILFQIIQSAPFQFQQSLERNDHSPHITLFLAFLELFQLFQDDLNQLPQRHLDFYYKEVLQLKTKTAIADQVHLFFELAKNIQEHELKKDTRFKAGKDSEGNDLFYALEQDNVFNRAQVVDLKTIFKDDDNHLNIAPIANSADGAGTPFSKTVNNPSWATLGAKNNLEDTYIGFAIASRELLLAEGTRTVTITFEGNGTNGDFELPIKENLNIEVSGEKDWIRVTQDVDKITNKKVIKFTLDASMPAVVPFNAEKLKTDLGTDLPVVRIRIPKAAMNYELWKGLTISKITLHIKVSGMSDILAFNDLGPVDPKKSFLPFGPIPKKGSSLYVGSREAFQKSLESVTLGLEWEGLKELPVIEVNNREKTDFKAYYKGYDDSPTVKDFTIDAKILKSQGDKNLTGKIELFQNGISFNSNLAFAIQESELEDYNTTTNYGFIEIRLNKDFLHDQFQSVMTRQMLAAAQYPTKILGAYYSVEGESEPQKATSAEIKMNKATVIIPNPPYTPSLKHLTLSYTSESTTDTQNDIQLIHLHPFENTYQVFEAPDGKTLLPQFEEQGALFVGVENLESEQSLSLLFQLSENTADAEVETAIIKWQYLRDNTWTDFKDHLIPADSTEGLIKSGIVQLAIPADINKNNTVLPNHLHWIKAATLGSPKAVSKVISVHAQAAKVIFQNNTNAADHLLAPLPAKTIGKLELGDAAVKKIEQLYPSFGGRVAESSTDFYIRISERLRHKGRAITLYDYERLVLEAFPELYKVKCLNHSTKEFILQAGEIVIAVIPDFKNLEIVDRLQPKVTKSKLLEIKAFLEERNTVFVRGDYLNVLNPVYEKIKVDFKVKFKSHITALGFHEEKLKAAIEEFLAPWAFSSAIKINFGGKIHRSDILNFVEEQDYVDHVIDFKMMRDNTDDDASVIEANTPISIFIPSENTNIDSKDFNCKPNEKSKIDKRGLGYEKLEDLTLSTS
ncbi:MAG: hypothetical protein AAGG68_10305 [Bacteroidota bacterium]